MYDYREYLERFKKQRNDIRRLWNIGYETADFLSFLVSLKQPEYILEIGTSNGFSTFHLSIAGESTASRIDTIECDRERFEMAMVNLAGRENIDLHYGKAEDIIPELRRRYDFIFIDANKESYKTYLELLIPKMNNRALIVADNINSHRRSVNKYVSFVRSDTRFQSLQIPLESGLEITIYLDPNKKITTGEDLK